MTTNEQWWVWTVRRADSLTFKVRPYKPPERLRDGNHKISDVKTFSSKRDAIHEAAARFASVCIGDGYYCIQVGGAQ